MDLDGRGTRGAVGVVRGDVRTLDRTADLMEDRDALFKILLQAEAIEG